MPTTLHHPAGAILTALEAEILGKSEVLRMVAAALLAGGHLLLEDVPGVGKTRLARTVAAAVGGSWRRIQGAPDLLPSDLTGTSLPEAGGHGFRFIPGPLFANVVLADELNRANPRTQSALLEAMEEGQVTVDGTAHPLPSPFWVIATQNPVELAGTFGLPEAQLDRFALVLSLGYPDEAAEVALLARAVGDRPHHPAVAEPLGLEALVAWRAEARAVHMAKELQAYIVAVAHATRNHPALRLGLSPRGALAWQSVAQALALLSGRRHVTPDDLAQSARPCLAHRLLAPGGAGARDAALNELLARVPLPS